MMRMGLPPEGGAQVVTLGRIVLDGTRLKDNGTHKAMSYGRMPERGAALAAKRTRPRR